MRPWTAARSTALVAIDEEPQAILRALGGGMAPRLAARRLQNYIVQVPPRDRGRLIENGHVRFVEDFGDQFAVLRTENFYSRETGLVWEKADEPGFDGIV